MKTLKDQGFIDPMFPIENLKAGDVITIGGAHDAGYIVAKCGPKNVPLGAVRWDFLANEVILPEDVMTEIGICG